MPTGVDRLKSVRHAGFRAWVVRAACVGVALGGVQVPAQQNASGSISGSAVRIGSGEALSGVSMDLRMSECAETSQQSVGALVTQRDGRFAFQNLRPGNYCLSAAVSTGDYL